MIIFNHI